ncbi:hypothetical protein J0871_16490 [Salegentibacter sp. BDJ18]|uniref:hypothetical protein n=1 Tax=Salegentibacter sp. BDJ18 TaxID=2816376 RepID=UPI001AAF4514|nr:hypothetical protein [Salegentibacter sp. BDJ18]MBO2546017.1 hypothetical protein [Salegentibacter sp. BDJ18]
MELYIEKEFLDNFYASYMEEQSTKGQEVIKTILKDYEEIEWFFDHEIETEKQLEKLKVDNPFFAYRCSYSPPLNVVDFEQHIFENSNFAQTIVLTEVHQDWFPKAEAKGVLCMNFNNYEERIAEIIDSCHFKVDLSKSFIGWEIFNFTKNVPINFLSINDNYILTDKKEQKMDRNIISILKYFLKDRKEKVSIKVLTKEFNAPQAANPEMIAETAHKRHNRINSALANFSKEVYTINNEYSREFDLHDRTIFSNFLMIDSGKGFNLIPHKPSNSQIIVESIFNKYTYNRIRNHNRNHQKYLEKLKKLETKNFKYVPDL